jgi:hypothetical protein
MGGAAQQQPTYQTPPAAATADIRALYGSFFNNPWKIFFAPVDRFGRVCRRGAVGSLCVPHAAAWHARGTWARTCRATCTGTAALPRPRSWRGSGRHTTQRGLLSSSSSLSSSCQSPTSSVGTTAATGRHTPNPVDLWWDSVGNRTPYPWEGIALI